MKNIQILLWPFALLYEFIIKIWSWMYRKGYWGRAKFAIPIISVGNIQAGGTGKTPLVEFICMFLSDEFHIGVLSRGYRRVTHGFRHVHENDNYRDVGDEPLWLKRRCPQVAVGVSENRIEGVPYLVGQNMHLNAIVLDDGFQQLGIQINLNILLTPFHRPFTKDSMIPMGKLREPIAEASRADIIVITKCPKDRLENVQQVVKDLRLNILPHQEVFLSSINYSSPYLLGYEGLTEPLSKDENILLITGIADTSSLLNYVQSKTNQVKHISFPDHYNFRYSDLKFIQKEFVQLFKEGKTRILTTEKDAIRLSVLRQELRELQLEIYVQGISIIMNNEEKFKERVFQALKKSDANQEKLDFEGH
ncbi:MAG: tetraacyldisaccharide 4'-kinase [Chitinophagales bacterium]|nr:tetraacyldisaccharide 4'-kinase [Chitinophagales bacterium]